MEAVAVCVCTSAEVQHSTAEKPHAKGIAKLSQAAKLRLSNALTHLDLDSRHRSVITFEDEVDLVAIVRSPVASLRGGVHPADLLEDLRYAECLQQVPELRHGLRL